MDAMRTGRNEPLPESPDQPPGTIRGVTILIDPPRWPAHGRLWSHLVSDAGYAELHEFAAAQGIPARGFDHDHYDVPQERYADLVTAGAVPVETRELLRRLNAAGLRRPKRDRRPPA
jgi:hypothetical protein